MGLRRDVSFVSEGPYTPVSQLRAISEHAIDLRRERTDADSSTLPRGLCRGSCALSRNPRRSSGQQGSGAIVLPSDADIRQVLAERVDALAGQEDGIAIVSWAWSERKVEGLSRAAI